MNTTYSDYAFPGVTLASGNAIKIQEFRTLLQDIDVLNLDVPEMQAVDSNSVVEHKLAYLRRMNYTGPIVVEDTALHLHSWNGLPGALVKWFVASIPLNELFEIFYDSRNPTATATSIVGVLAAGETRVWRGDLTGSIVRPRGELGGWTSIFEVSGTSKTLGEMEFQERIQVTMRRAPIERLGEWLIANAAVPKRRIFD